MQCRSVAPGRGAAGLLPAALLVLCTATAARAREPFPGLEAYIANAVADRHLPGLGIAIVRNDSLVFAWGFGVLAVGATTPVDEHTLFEIGSSSTAFTATIVAMLVGEGNLGFDDRIARGELTWLGSGISRKEVFHRVRFLEPQTPFRSSFAYHTIMFLAAGEVTGESAGTTWDDLVRERIYGPLRETHEPQMLMGGFGGGGGGAAGERVTYFNAYGPGWMVQDYRGHRMVQHGGNTDGLTSAVGILPDQQLGVAVFADIQNSQLPAMILRYVFDRHLGVPEQDLSGEARAWVVAQWARADSVAAAQESEPPAPGKPPLPLRAFAAILADSLYGEVVVSENGDGLELRRGDWHGPLEYVTGTNFRWTILPSSPTGPINIKFDIPPTSQVTGLYLGTGGDTTLLRRRRSGSGGPGGTTGRDGE